MDSRPLSDLIYTRLDLPHPPAIDRAEFDDWLVSASRTLMRSKFAYEASEGKEYPWRGIVACADNVWEPEFAQRFPELVRYCGLFPASYWHRVCVLAQRPNASVFVHTDPDHFIGWRIYLSHGGPKLYFRKFKERLKERPETWASGGPAAIDALCSDERHYVTAAEEPFSWALTSIRAAHGVEPGEISLGDRVTVVLLPDPSSIDQTAHERLLRQSAAKHADTALWY